MAEKGNGYTNRTNTNFTYTPKNTAVKPAERKIPPQTTPKK